MMIPPMMSWEELKVPRSVKYICSAVAVIYLIYRFRYG